MAETEITETRTRDRAMWIGLGIAALVTVIAVAAGVYFARALPLTAFEAEPRSVGPGYVALSGLMGLFGDGVAVGRAFGVFFLAMAVAATALLGRRASGDWPVGACLALAWILFPPVLAIQVMNAPIGPATALMAVALAALWPGPKPARGQDGLGAFALMFAALMGPAGAWGTLVVTLYLLFLRPRLWTVLAPALGAGLAIVAISLGAAGFSRDPDWIAPEHSAVQLGALLPFAMVWVGSGLAAIVSRSSVTKYRLGLRPLWVCRAAPFVFAGLIALAGSRPPTPGATYLSAGAAFFPLALIGILPLVVWVRFAMPRIRSLPAWLAFPVIMYCCFWVILGPITRDRFPFGLIPSLAAPFTGNPTPAP